jgi:hypothetical protein
VPELERIVTSAIRRARGQQLAELEDWAKRSAEYAVGGRDEAAMRVHDEWANRFRKMLDAKASFVILIIRQGPVARQRPKQPATIFGGLKVSHRKRAFYSAETYYAVADALLGPLPAVATGCNPDNVCDVSI